MRIHAVLTLLLSSIILSACALGAPENEATIEPTLTPFAIATEATAEVTETVTPTNTAMPTVTSTRTVTTTNTSGNSCTNDLTFIADMSVPDGTSVVAGSTITKTWRVRNDGTCAWNSNYTFRQIGGEALTGATISPSIVGAGQQVDLTVTLTVGDDVANYDDDECATFRMFNPAGVAFGDSPFVEVEILIADSPNPTCTDGVTIISEPIGNRGNNNGMVGREDVRTETWTIQNSGDCTWQGYSVVEHDFPTQSEIWEIPDFLLTSDDLPISLPIIEPGESHTFTLDVKIEDDFSGFGLLYLGLAVQNKNSNNILDLVYFSEADTTADCTFDSDFVSDITIPDGTVVEAGETFTKTWRIENSGTCLWSNFSFVMLFDENPTIEVVADGDRQSVLVPYAEPGDQIDVSIDLWVLESVADGTTARATFQMDGGAIGRFGTMLYVEVEVSNE
ncbi:MAG: NBR1-Ig-like domain-containing protein [Chloroflexota bacterium]